MPKGRKKRRAVAEPVPPRKGTFQYRPFAAVEIEVPQAPPEREPERPPVPAREAAGAIPESDDEALAEMMSGVRPLGGGKRLAEQAVRLRPSKAELDDAALVMQELDELVHGNAPFEMNDTEEFVEAAVKGLDRRLLRKLRRGEYAIQAHIDLHGMRREEARLAVARFVERCQTEGKRCVLIVHGRGLGSKDNIPVLKEKLTAWLTRGAIGRRVLAFTSARPWDGGTGAVYVLLRG